MLTGVPSACSTAFLMGPMAQLRKMFDKGRVVATLVSRHSAQCSRALRTSRPASSPARQQLLNSSWEGDLPRLPCTSPMLSQHCWP